MAEDRTWMVGGRDYDLMRVAAGGCCERSRKTCSRPPCPINLDTYSDEELREIEARRAGATSFNGRPVIPL